MRDGVRLFVRSLFAAAAVAGCGDSTSTGGNDSGACFRRGSGGGCRGVVGFVHAGKRRLAGSFGHCGRKSLGWAKTGHKMLMGWRRVSRQLSPMTRRLRMPADVV